MKPLFDALRAYSARSGAVFHMPGHKLGHGFEPCSGFCDAASFDVTELTATDDLHNPKGPIKEAQELAAAVFGAGRTWFLTNGSSAGICAMISSVCREGSKLLIARDFHYSAYNAMSFVRVKPVFIPVRGIAANQSRARFCVPEPDDVREALDDNPDAAAVYITRPNYFGCVCDIVAIAALTKERGIPLLVDEAHGAHFVFSERLPICAMSSGASLCVQSAHKTLPAFTQSGYLHVSRKALADDTELADRVSASCRAFQTSSPSFLLMASLDYAREFMEERGAAELLRVMTLCGSLTAEMELLGYGTSGCDSDIDNIRRISDGTQRHTRDGTTRYKRDVTRVVLNTAKIGISGHETGRLMAERYNIGIEMSDREHIVMIATVADRERDFASLTDALTDIAHDNKRVRNNDRRQVRTLTDQKTTDIKDIRDDEYSREPKLRVFAAPAIASASSDIAAPDFINMLHTSKLTVPLSQSAYMRSAELVTPYPPGIPMLCPGESVTPQIIAALLEQYNSGAQITGLIK